MLHVLSCQHAPPKVEIYNIFDKCVRLELPISKMLKDETRLALKLNVTFSDMWLSIEDPRFGGLWCNRIRANFGISRGWLSFWGLTNVLFPTEGRKFSFEINVVSEGTHGYTKETTKSSSKGVEFGPEVNVDPTVGITNIKTSAKMTLKGEAGTKVALSDTFGKPVVHVQELRRLCAGITKI